MFGYLPDIHNNSRPLGTLSSGSFSERMISVENLLVDEHLRRLGQNIVDVMVVLRMNKRFMERMRHKEAFVSIMFKDVLSVN